jgi:hypothetical protein
MITAPQWPAVGIHPGISPASYFAPHKGNVEDRMISKSLLWDFAANPLRWVLSPEKEVTEGMKWGSLVDCLALTPERFKDSYRVQPENYCNLPAKMIVTDAFEGEWNGKLKVCREWKADREQEGFTVLTPEQFKEANQFKPWNWNSTYCQAWRDALPAGVACISEYQMREAERAVKALGKRPEFAEMMAGARTQVGMRFDFGAGLHGIDGFTARAKGLIDIVPDIDGEWGGYLVDLKTTAKLDDIDQVERTIWNYGYHAQAALYIDMWNALTGEDREGFIFVFQLASAPYEVAVVELDEEAIIAGREWYLGAVRKWAETVTSGRWQSPWDGVKQAGIPAWAAKKRREAA